MKSLAVAVAGCLLLGLPASAEILSSVDPGLLPDRKHTRLGLYLTAEDAAAALAADPGIVFVDARDPIEIAFVGHPEPIDAIVPFQTATLEFDAGSGEYRMAPNPGFVTQVDALMARERRGRGDPVFLICRSGNRSAEAADALAAAGYTNVWNLVEGFEGDRDTSGKRTLDGWRNAGLPWTYTLTPEQAWPRAE